jgi:hypothetical protein
VRCTHSAVWCVLWALFVELRWSEHEADQSSPSAKFTNSNCATFKLSRVSLSCSVTGTPKTMMKCGFFKVRFLFGQISYCQLSKYINAQSCGINHKSWLFWSGDTCSTAYFINVPRTGFSYLKDSRRYSRNSYCCFWLPDTLFASTSWEAPRNISVWTDDLRTEVYVRKPRTHKLIKSCTLLSCDVRQEVCKTRPDMLHFLSTLILSRRSLHSRFRMVAVCHVKFDCIYPQK